MEYLSVKEWAALQGVSERTARNYCAQGKIKGAKLVANRWNIPSDASFHKEKLRKPISPLLTTLRQQAESKIKGGIYHRIQIDLTYNSNHIEGSRLSQDQTRYIFETNTIGIKDQVINIDDIIETSNHFRAIDFILLNTDGHLTESYIKHLHFLIKSSTSDERKGWFRVGEYKTIPNEVGGMNTTAPEDVSKEMINLLKNYNSKKKPEFIDVLDFHHKFEMIHPFQDGNGRVGRLIMFRECLRLGYVPFIIYDELKIFYYNGLRNWPHIKEYLLDTCLSAQDNFKILLDKFRIPYE